LFSASRDQAFAKVRLGIDQPAFQLKQRGQLKQKGQLDKRGG